MQYYMQMYIYSNGPTGHINYRLIDINTDPTGNFYGVSAPSISTQQVISYDTIYSILNHSSNRGFLESTVVKNDTEHDDYYGNIKSNPPILPRPCVESALIPLTKDEYDLKIKESESFVGKQFDYDIVGDTSSIEDGMNCSEWTQHILNYGSPTTRVIGDYFTKEELWAEGDGLTPVYRDIRLNYSRADKQPLINP